MSGARANRASALYCMTIDLAIPTTEARSGSKAVWVVVAILAIHAALLAYLAARHSPTIHEMAHLPAGICHWQYGMFDLYRVNPPLPRMVAALPVLFCRHKADWGNYQLDPLSRETIPMGIRFANANGARTLFLFMVGRWACIPFCLLGGWVCYRWARELWGTTGRTRGALPLVLQPADSRARGAGDARRAGGGDGRVCRLALLDMAPRADVECGGGGRIGARPGRVMQDDALAVFCPLAIGLATHGEPPACGYPA